MKRAVTLVILFSMMLHCAGRLGVLSSLYKNRHQIAHTIGLIAEVPIAMCSSDYGDVPLLTFEAQQTDEAVPFCVHAAIEINLYCVDQPELNAASRAFDLIVHSSLPADAFSIPPADPIFHPPLC